MNVSRARIFDGGRSHRFLVYDGQLIFLSERDEAACTAAIHRHPIQLAAIPFVGILQEMKHVPFADKPAKCAYMWRDIERRAAMHGIPASLPAPYPAKQSVMANLVATVGMRQGWGKEFVHAAYRRWLQLGQETGSEPNLSESLREIGQDPQAVLASANSAETEAALMAETGIARELGIFGSPTFVVGRELFWGDDRLEDAISWRGEGCVGVFS